MDDGGSDESLRERKKRQTRLTLRRVAAELMVERGFDDVTIDEIAARAEVAKSTFYRYFSSKQDVFLADADERIDQLRDALASRPATEPVVGAVHNAVLELADRFEGDRDELLAIAQVVQATPALQATWLEQQARWEVVLREFVAERLDEDPDLDLRSRVVAGNVVATLRSAIDLWIATQASMDLAVLVASAMDIMGGPTGDPQLDGPSANARP